MRTAFLPTAGQRVCRLNCVLTRNAHGESGHESVPSQSARKKRRPMPFEVKVVTPPTRSLGVHALPANTHNGDVVHIEEVDYIVQRLVIQFKLVKGRRYERDLSRLDCMSASRFLLNRNLESCLQSTDSQQ